MGVLTPRVSDAGRRDFRWKESGRLEMERDTLMSGLVGKPGLVGGSEDVKAALCRLCCWLPLFALFAVSLIQVLM